MIEKIPSKKKIKDMAIYSPDAPLPSFHELKVDANALPEPIVAAIEHLYGSQGPIFSDFGIPDEDVRDVLLESNDNELYLAARVLTEDNWVSGLVVNRDNLYSEFYTNVSENETFIEVSIPTAGREPVESIVLRMDALNEFAKTRCFSTVYSTSNPHHEALEVWKTLEAQGKAHIRSMPGGQTKYFLL
jgi:hypothetical protein